MIYFLTEYDFSTCKSIAYAIYDFLLDNNTKKLELKKQTLSQLEYIANNFLRDDFKHTLINHLYPYLIELKPCKDKELTKLIKNLRPYLIPFLNKQQYL